MRNKFSWIIVVFLTVISKIDAQSISPSVNNDYCPGTDITFTVTLIGTGYSGISVSGLANSIAALVVTNAYNINTGSGNTVFDFVGRFYDYNNTQAFRVSYTGGNVDFQYPKIKSFQTTVSESIPQPTPTPITATRCQTQNFNISFSNVQFANPWVNPKQVYGTETNYEYLLPVDWVLNGTTSTGSNWIAGTNNVTVTSDASHGDGGSIKIRAVNACGSSLIKGPEATIPVSRPRPFLSISGDDYICSGSKTYNISGSLPSGATVCWSSSNTNYGTVPSSPNNCGTSISVSYVASGVITLTATVTDCIESYSVTKPILIGASIAGYYTIWSDYHNPGYQWTLYNNNSVIWLPANKTFQVTAYINSPGFQSASWSRAANSYSFSWNTTSNTLSFWGSSGSSAYQERDGIFNVSAQTSCGTYNGTYTWPVIVQGWGFSISVSPNPATDNLLVSIQDESPDVKALGEEENITMTLYDLNSTVVIKKWSFKNIQNKFSLNITGIKRGQYILVVSKGKYQQSKQIIIE